MGRWKIIGGILIVLAVAALAGVIGVNAVAGRRMKDLQVKVAALQAETAARDTSRPPRPGKSEPGNAWDDYTAALAAVEKDKEALKAVAEYVDKPTPAGRAKAEPIVAAHAATLDLLRKGVRRERGEATIRWEDGFAIKTPGLMSPRALGNLAAAKARFLLEEGKAREGVDLLLDVCQYARDQGSNTILIEHMVCLALTSTASEELKTFIQSGKLTREDLLEIDRGLDHVEKVLPNTAHAFMNEPLQLGHHTLKEISGDNFIQMGDGPSIYQLKYGFSLKIMAAEAFNESVAIMRRGAEADSKSWAEVRKLSDEMEKVSRESANPLIQITVPGLASVHRVSREKKAHLRMLRTAARLKAGETADLDDPFGGKLLRSEKDGKLKIWSVGRDGVDDSGVGEWKADDKSKDIVLEVNR